jgi:hypothetical protein
VAAGAISNFSLIFSPATVGTAYTAAVHLANNSAITTYILNLTGTGGNGLLDQTITFPPLPTQKITSQVGLAATSSSGLPVSFGVLFGPGVIHDGTNLTFSTVGTVAVLAAQPGNAEWNPAPNVTNRFLVLGDAAFSLRATALTNSVMLRWTDPLSAGLSNPAVLVRCHTSHYPTNTGDGTLTYQGTNTVFHHVDLTNGQTYYYTIWVSHDGAVFIDPP